MSLGLRPRFTLWFCAAALLPIVTTAVISWWRLSSGYREDFDRKLAASHADAQRAFNGVKDSVKSAVDAAKENPMVALVLLDLEKNGEISAQLRQDLTRDGLALMHSLGLQVLTLTGKDDVVLAAPHFPGHVEEADAEPRHLAETDGGMPVVAWAKALRQNQVTRVLVVEAARKISDHNQEVTVLVGRELGEDLLRPLHGDGVEARLTDDQGKELMSTTSDWSKLGGAPDQDLVLDDGAGKPIAHVIVAVSDAELRRRLRDVAILYTVLGLIAVLVAAIVGYFVSRRMTRDVTALVSGVQAVSRGDLEVRVDVRAKDEVGELAEAFNKMTEDLRSAKDALIHAERVAAWQEIAKSLAHEIKNPLTPIQMSVETMRKTYAAQHPSFGEIFDESTRTVLEEVQRLKKIVGEFSQFARMPGPERRACDLNELVGSALSLYRGSVKAVRELATVLPRIEADRDQLTQVILNLLENARDAVTSKGSDESIGKIMVRTRIKGNGIELEIEDNGPGFDPNLKEKLFQPYFTTKETGTGLGLAIVRRIITDHGGRISAFSDPGKGARFVVELPTAVGVFSSTA